MNGEARVPRLSQPCSHWFARLAQPWRTVARWAPFVVPPCLLVLIFCLQPRDHMGPPDAAPWLYSSLYDDYDVTSWAFRGLNAACGRMAGAHDPPHIPTDEEFSQSLHSPDQVLQPRYHLEFPPGALLFFRLGWIGQSDLDSYPPAILDGDYNAFVRHTPVGERERRWWEQFRWVDQVYMVLVLGFGLGLIAVLRWGYEPGGRLTSSGLLLLMPAALWFMLNRFDALPALLTALSLACMGRRWTAASAALLAAATAVKLFPVLLAPLVLRHLVPDWRRAVVWAGCYAVVLAGCLLPPLLMYGWPGLWEPLCFQLTRQLERFTIYGPILPVSLSENDPAARGFRLGTLALTVIALCWTRPADLASLLRRAAVLLIVFIGLSVWFSPQWVLWLAPLCLPLARGNRPLVGLLIALDLVTYFTFPVYSPVWGPIDAGGVDRAVYARFAVLGALIALLSWQEWRRKPQAAAGGAPMAEQKPGAAGRM
jgi:hypothetical protein